MSVNFEKIKIDIYNPTRRTASADTSLGCLSTAVSRNLCSTSLRPTSRTRSRSGLSNTVVVFRIPMTD